MTTRSYLITTLFLGTLLLGISACAPTVTISRLRPAKINEASNLRKITVLDFTGKDGKKLAEDIGQVLKDIHVKHKPYFDVKSEESFYKAVIHKKKLRTPPEVASQRAPYLKTERISLGRATRTEGLLTGSILKRSCTTSFFSKKASECVKYKKRRKGERPAPEACQKYFKYSVQCVENTARYSFATGLIDINSGEEIYFNIFTGTRDISTCKNDTGIKRGLGGDATKTFEAADKTRSARGTTVMCKPSLEQQLLRGARASALAEARIDISKKLAPHFEKIRIPLMNSNKGMRSIKAKVMLEQGIYTAKKLNIWKACEIWKEARDIAPRSAAIAYNLGVCAEYYGGIKEARHLYEESGALLGKENKKITCALARTLEKKAEPR